MGSQASKESGDEASLNEAEADHALQQRRTRRELSPNGDEISEFMSADDDKGAVGISGVNVTTGGTEDEIKLSSSGGEGKEQEEDAGRLDGVNETALESETAAANTSLNAKDDWWARLASRTDETVARIMRGYGSQPSTSQQVAEEADGSHVRAEGKKGVGANEHRQDRDITLAAQPDEDHTQVVRDSIILQTELSMPMIDVADQDSGHGSMAASEAGMPNTSTGSEEQEAYMVSKPPNDQRLVDHSRQDRADATEETVRRIQAERNGDAVYTAGQFGIRDPMVIEGYRAATYISPSKLATTKISRPEDLDEKSLKEYRAIRKAKKKERRAVYRQQKTLELAIQKRNDGYGNGEDLASATEGAVGLGQKLSMAKQHNDRAEEIKKGSQEERVENLGMGGGATRIETMEEGKKEEKAGADEDKRSRCDTGLSRRAEKRRMRKARRRAAREAAEKGTKAKGHVEGTAGAPERMEKKRKSKGRRRAGLEARGGGIRVDGHGGEGAGLAIET